MNLNLGHITYANCAPFFYYLRESGFAGKIVPGVPSELNSLLCAGEIDVSPSSSFEYGRNCDDYLLLPGHSISSCGPVQSVLLFTSCRLEDLEGKPIALTGESATSVNLLQVLLLEYLGFKEVSCAVPEAPLEELIAAGGAALLIGDRALKASMELGEGQRVYDLGELWSSYTGLPFVFALWILRREAAQEKRGEVQALLGQLADSRERAFGGLDTLAALTSEGEWLGEKRLVEYWRCMSYDLSDSHLQGLRLFFALCLKHGLLERMPEISFFE